MRPVELVADLRLELGECPRWRPGERALYLVDIAACRLHRLDPRTGALRTRQFDQPVGSFAFREGGGFVLAMRDGFALLDDWDAPLRPFGPPVEAGREHTRFNDGRTDPQGRFWAGTRDATRTRRDAALYRLTPEGEVTAMADGALTANGAAFSPDGRTFYWADTPAHLIRAYDFDGATGAISRARVFRQFPFGDGRPDGASVDADGDYWSALYAGACVVRLSPAGEELERVDIPARNPTMAAFGGDDLRTVFVTTARDGTPDDERARHPHAGGVFAFRVETPGLPETPFAG